MRELKINNLQVYDYEGKGDALIFVHAFPLSSKMWKPQTDFFRNNFRVITYDIRGLGRSAEANNQFTMEEYSNDLTGIIEHFNFEKVFVCGVSMGGYIILRSYIKKPDLFKGLVLADTRAEKDDDSGLISRSNVILSIKNGKRDDFISGFLPKLINKKNYLNPELRNFLESIIKDNTNEGICGAQLALATRTDTSGNLSSFKVPVLIVVGEDDELTPVSCAEAMRKSIPKSEMEVIAGSGHLSNLENPELFNKCVNEFLKVHI